MMTRIRVVLADDHAVVRKGIHDFLVEEGDIDVVAEASDGEMVKQLILEHRPDVVILDVRMPGATGIEVTRWVREQGLPLKVLILTAYDDRPFVTAALQAGANGYVLKNADAEQITAAVRAVFYGYAAFDPAVTAKALTQGPGAGSRAAAAVEPLTEREQDVLKLAARGLTNRGIGVQLKISDRTVQNHLANIFEKLMVGSRTEAVTKAIQLGVFELPDNDAGFGQ